MRLSFPRKWPRFQIHLSTLLVIVLTAGALMGVNFRPFEFYYPRPEWVEDLKMFLPRIDDNQDRFALGVYGWPLPAFPTWNWMGNGMPAAEFPSWQYYTNDAAGLHVACTIKQWNYKALGFDFAFCLGTAIFAGAAWQFGAQKFSARAAKVITS